MISKRVAFGTIIVLTILIFVWVILYYYGGEKESLGAMEAAFYSSNSEINDTVVFYLINYETPIVAYVTNKDNANKAMAQETFGYLKGHEYKIEPYERKSIEFTIEDEGKFGLLVVPDGDFERSTFRIQVREPLMSGHVRYSIYVPIVLMAFIVFISLGFSLQSSPPEPLMSEGKSSGYQQPAPPRTCQHCGTVIIWDENQQRWYCSHCKMYV